MPTRLHLGCGERYLEGYVNIDYPLDQHSVQISSPADLHADITELSYEPATVAEVRLHHVFEHFDRVTALRLLIDWYAWLEEGGLLLIETPDFEASVRRFLKLVLGRAGVRSSATYSGRRKRAGRSTPTVGTRTSSARCSRHWDTS